MYTAYQSRVDELLRVVDEFQASGGKLEWKEEKYLWFFKKKTITFSKHGKHLYTVDEKSTFDYGFQRVLIQEIKKWTKL